MKDIKQSHPIQVAECAVARGIDKLPQFTWCVKYTLKKRDGIIAAAKARVVKSTHKYGIEVPTSVAHAYEIDRKNGNRLWCDTMEKEIANIGVAFDILENDQSLPIGYTKTSGHIVFDVRMDFTQKARYVKNGNLTPRTLDSNFAGVVLRECVQISFAYAAMNDFNVWACDVQNAYIQAPSSEKHYIICGPEFGVHQGKRALIVRALYGELHSDRDYWLQIAWNFLISSRAK